MKHHNSKGRLFKIIHFLNMSKLNTVDWVALVLLIIGGLNWALVGLVSFDLVAAIFGDMSALTRVVYILVGLSAVYFLCSSISGSPPATFISGLF